MFEYVVLNWLRLCVSTRIHFNTLGVASFIRQSNFGDCQEDMPYKRESYKYLGLMGKWKIRSTTNYEGIHMLMCILLVSKQE